MNCHRNNIKMMQNELNTITNRNLEKVEFEVAKQTLEEYNKMKNHIKK